jgi:membrane protein
MIGKLIALLKESIKEFQAVHGTLLAASISFTLLFSLFPLAFAAVYIAGSLSESSNIQQQVIRSIVALLPMPRALITGILANVAVSHDAISAVTFLGLIWGGLSCFNAIRVSLNAVWGIQNPHFILKAYFINLLMMVGAAILLILSFLFTNMFSAGYAPGMQPGELDFLHRNAPVRILANILFTGPAFLVLYRFIPSKRPQWRDIWVAALAAAICFELTKFIFMWYVRIFDPYNLIYGSIGTLIAFLMWTYLSALAFLFIAKMTCINLEKRNKSALTDPRL